MRRLLYIILLLATLMVIASCRSSRQATSSVAERTARTDTVIRERIVRVPTPEDSARLFALMRCDSNGRVLLAWYEQEVSRNAELKFSIDSLGRVIAKFRTMPDTVYVQVADTTVHREKTIIEKETVTVEVPARLSRWQSYLQVCGLSANILFIIAFFGLARKLNQKIRERVE